MEDALLRPKTPLNSDAKAVSELSRFLSRAELLNPGCTHTPATRRGSWGAGHRHGAGVHPRTTEIPAPGMDFSTEQRSKQTQSKEMFLMQF